MMTGVSLLLMSAATWTAGLAGSVPTATSPADAVLVRIGAKVVVTQEEFNRALKTATLDEYLRNGDLIVQSLIEDRLLLLYLEDHPELVKDDEVEEMVQQEVKRLNLKSPEQMEEKYLAPWGATLDDFRRDQRRILARTALVRRGMEIAKDRQKMQALFQADPEEYDETRVEFRQVVLGIQPYETPAQRAAKRERLLKMREELLAGKRTWEECVKQSDDQSRGKEGYMGFLPRHLHYYEPVMAEAFRCKEGQLSEVVESPVALHLLKVGRRRPGGMTYEQAEPMMKIWMEKKQYLDMIDEMARKHPIVGVQAPSPPPHLKELVESAASQPASQPAPEQVKP